MSDLHFAAAVLDGTVVTSGAWRPGGTSRQGEGGPRPRGRSGAGGGAAAAGGASKQVQQGQRPSASPQPQHRPKQQRQQQQQRGSDARAAPGQGAAADAPACSQPGPRSMAHVAHCEACDVFVPRRPGDWEVHLAGIRHRRQLLSLRVHGERNRLVLSAFESLPASGELAHRLVGVRAAQQFGLPPPHGGHSRTDAGGAAPPPELLQAARRLRTEALKQLLNMFGVGQIYNSAAAGFEERQLARCLQRAATAEQPSAQPSSTCCRVVATGAVLASLAHLALTGRLDAAELAITLAPQPADAPRSQHAGLAAALPAVLGTQARSGSLSALQLSLPPLGGPDAARLEQLWQQAWQHTLPALRDLLGSSAPLRTLRLELPACLHADTAAYAPQLHAAAQAAPLAVRRHVLLALHPRAGRGALLQLLPLGVLRQILDLAAPLQPCAVQVVGPASAAEAAAGQAAA